MRITTETLHKIAADAVADRTKANKQIIAAYLHGSLLGEDALLGQTTDIDLTIVYRRGFAPEQKRELVRISPDIHLDILHHDEALYKPPRNLRTKPWLGYSAYDFKPLFDPKHYLEFVQAGVRNTFFEPEIVLERAQYFYSIAREIWTSDSLIMGTDRVYNYSRFLTALEASANALVSLNGAPLTTRRLVNALPERLKEFQDDGLLAGFLGLTGLNQTDQVDIDAALHAWHEVYPQAAQLPQNADAMPLFRLSYFRNAVQGYLDEGKQASAVWILLKTWLAAVLSLSRQDDQSDRKPLVDTISALGFATETMQDRWAGLDMYLDKIEVLFEDWKVEKGI